MCTRESARRCLALVAIAILVIGIGDLGAGVNWWTQWHALLAVPVPVGVEADPTFLPELHSRATTYLWRGAVLTLVGVSWGAYRLTQRLRASTYPIAATGAARGVPEASRRSSGSGSATA